MASFDKFKECPGSRYKKNYMEGIMLQTVKGYYYKGRIELEENIKIKKKVPVLITFLEERRSESLSAIERVLKREPVKISPDKVVDLIAEGRR